MLYFKNYFCLIICSLLFFGCGQSRNTPSEIYNKAFSQQEDIDCPEGMFIKGKNTLKRINQSEEVLYTLEFEKVNWRCYVLNKDNYQNYYIELITSFKVDYEVDKESINLENFEYVVALLDIYERVVLSNKYSYDFYSDDSLLSFNSKNEKRVLFKVKAEKVGLLNESTLLLGFIK